MPSRFRRGGADYELLPHSSLDSHDSHDAHDAHESPEHDHLYAVPPAYDYNPSRLGRLANGLKQLSLYIFPRRRKRSVLRLVLWTLFFVPYLCIFAFFVAAAFFPSYSHPPAHYGELRRKSIASTVPGRANPHNETVFIAASLYESKGELTSGAWGQAVLELIDLLGPQNVYLSIYEDNADPVTQQSLLDFKQKAPCNSTIFFEDLDLKTLPRVALPSGETRLKRIAFLAEVRNRALAPIDKAGVAFDRVLYINDVNFKPIEAAQLLFSTNVDATGRANYGAACAVDFINPFKFYDRFATRDLDGFITGIPFFPWFTNAGTATSRNDVFASSDAVRVRSCWGGMTAFEAKWFQDPKLFADQSSSEPAPTSLTSPGSVAIPLRFRYEEYTFWESSECCLIHADLTYLRTGQGMPPESGIYMNPYIRVAYDPSTLSWLSFTRRPERLVYWAHNVLNKWVGFPGHNERQFEEPGQSYTDTIWEYDNPGQAFAENATGADFAGHWAQVEHIAKPGGFCGGRNLLVINENAKKGEPTWGKIPFPLPPAPPPGR